MPPPTIRPARTDEYDEIARVWMDSWASTGLEAASNFLLAKLRAHSARGRERLEPLCRQQRRAACGDAGAASAQTLSRPIVRRPGISRPKPRQKAARFHATAFAA